MRTRIYIRPPELADMTAFLAAGARALAGSRALGDPGALTGDDMELDPAAG